MLLPMLLPQRVQSPEARVLSAPLDPECSARHQQQSAVRGVQLARLLALLLLLVMEQQQVQAALLSLLHLLSQQLLRPLLLPSPAELWLVLLLPCCHPVRHA